MAYLLQVKRAKAFENVATGQQATCRLPIGKVIYHEIYIQGLTSAGVPVTAAQLVAEATGEFKLSANGETLYRCSLAQLHMLQAYYGQGLASIDGMVPLGISRRNLLGFNTNEALALGTANLTDLTLELTLGTLSNVASINVMAQTNVGLQNLGFHRRVLITNRTYAETSGQFEEDNMQVWNAAPDNGYLAFHIPDASSRITDVEFNVNGIPVIKDAHPDMLHQLARQAGRVPQSGYVHASFDLANIGAAHLNLNGAVDFNQKYTVAGGALGATQILTESIHKIPGDIQ